MWTSNFSISTTHPSTAMIHNVRLLIDGRSVVARHQLLEITIVIVSLHAHIIPMASDSPVVARMAVVPLRALGRGAGSAGTTRPVATTTAAACIVRNLRGQPVSRKHVAKLVVVLPWWRSCRPRLNKTWIVRRLLLEWLKEEGGG